MTTCAKALILGTLGISMSFPTFAQATPQVLEQPKRDDAAVQVLQVSLSAMGGSTLWGSIHSSTTEGSARLDIPGSSSNHFKWEDDWHGGRYRFRHEVNNGSSTNIHFADPLSESFLQKSGGTKQLPHGADGDSMPMFLPGVVLAAELRNTKYGVASTICDAPEFSHDICVRVSRGSTGAVAPQSEQEWFINPSTHLPDAVRLRTFNSARPSSPTRTLLVYRHFAALANNAMVPDRMQKEFSAFSETFELTAPLLNSSLDATEFIPSR